MFPTTRHRETSVPIRSLRSRFTVNFKARNHKRDVFPLYLLDGISRLGRIHVKVVCLPLQVEYFTTWRDIPLTLARAFGKRFRPSVANVEGIWETIWT